MFKRELRYIVVKMSDIGLSPAPFRKKLFNQLIDLAGKVSGYRQDAGKKPLECVVVESDWPEYEPIWDAIQRRMEGRPTREAELMAEVERLTAERDRYKAALERIAMDRSFSERGDDLGPTEGAGIAKEALAEEVQG